MAMVGDWRMKVLLALRATLHMIHHEHTDRSSAWRAEADDGWVASTATAVWGDRVMIFTER
jgi:hypothetical protein